MTNSELKAKAQALYEEHKNEYRFYRKRRQAGFVRRCKNLFVHIDIATTDPDMQGALMCLDIIALRAGFDYDN